LSLSARLEQELNSNKAVTLLDKLKNEISQVMLENSKLAIQFNQADMKLEAQTRNLTYLEDKLASALTEREE
jgi:hypothetical protein